jgi:hypothetical protein
MAPLAVVRSPPPTPRLIVCCYKMEYCPVVQNPASITTAFLAPPHLNVALDEHHQLLPLCITIRSISPFHRSKLPPVMTPGAPLFFPQPTVSSQALHHR